jgi:hypothetical protein
VDDALEAHRAAVISALLGVVGTVMGVAGFWRVSGPALRTVQALGILLGGSVYLWLHARGPAFSRRQSNALFLIVLVPTVVMTWLADDARAAHHQSWVPYEPNKLSALTLALIAPPGWSTGIAGILLFVGSALIHHLTWSDAVRPRISAGEPFGIIAYGVFALVVLGFKQRGNRLRAELERARAEKVALERLARVSIALRDLANTPVQTLELVRRRLLCADPQLGLQTERMGRALERLHRLNDILAPNQSAVVWNEDGPTQREIATATERISVPSKRTRRSSRPRLNAR